MLQMVLVLIQNNNLILVLKITLIYQALKILAYKQKNSSHK